MWPFGTKYELANKVVVLTGATGGLGSGLARLFKEKKCKLALLDIDQELLDKLVAELGPDVAHAWYADVTKMDQMTQVMKEVNDYYGHIDVVLAISGVGDFGPSGEWEEERWLRVIDINVNGAWRTFKVALPYLKETKGYFGCVSSAAAFLHAPFMSSYTASKAANYAMCNSIRSEVRPFGITVASFHPMFFESPLVKDATDHKSWNYLFDDHKPYFLRKIPPIDVYKQIVSAVENRSEFEVMPTSHYYLSLFSPLLRKFIAKQQDAKVEGTYAILEEEERSDPNSFNKIAKERLSKL